MNLTDGDWHRLHPATPLLRGGIAFVAIAGIVLANLRERLIEIFIPVPGTPGDPVDEIVNHGLVGWALLAVFVVLVAIIGVYYVSWRMHTFRVTDELVEVRSGLIFRTNRRARLDRIQGVTINRPLLARIFGAAKLDIVVAGSDGNVQMSYLGSAAADALRREILRLASGIRSAKAQQASAGTIVADSAASGAIAADAAAFGPVAVDGGALDGAVAAAGLPAGRNGAGAGRYVAARVGEFLAPELDPDAAPPESVVRIPIGRVIGSVILSGFTLFLIAAAVAIGIGIANGAFWPLFGVLPALIGGISYYISRTSRMLRYSIAGTSDGIRVGHGLLSTNNETLPPGRIHAVGVSQPLLWRPFGWWRLQVNTAGQLARDRQNRENTTILPVGSIIDVRRVLELILPAFTGVDAEGVVETGLTSRGGEDGFTNAPRSAVWLRPFSWKRTGFRAVGGLLLLRRGVLTRELSVVPLARLQSVDLRQGPLDRSLGLATVRAQTVAGPVTASLDVAAASVALELFERTAADAVRYAATDTSHQWGAV